MNAVVPSGWSSTSSVLAAVFGSMYLDHLRSAGLVASTTIIPPTLSAIKAVFSSGDSSNSDERPWVLMLSTYVSEV